MRRVFVATGLPADGPPSVVLAPEAAHYVGRVLRLVEGEELALFDTSGRRALGVLRWVSGSATLCDVQWDDRPAVAGHVELWAVVMRPQRWDWLLEKAAELGASRIVALQSERSVVVVPPGKAAARQERWQRQVGEAAKQCRADAAPLVDGPLQLRDALGQIPPGARVALLDEAGGEHSGAPFGEWLNSEWSGETPLVVASGPEGGWSNAERRLWAEAGAACITLGPRVLRAETAPLAALVVAQCVAGQLATWPGDWLRGESTSFGTWQVATRRR